MKAPTEILYTWLLANGHFTNPNVGGTWPVYRDALPDGPNVADNAAALYDTAGVIQAKDMIGVVNQRYGIQIKLRCRPNVDGYAKVESVLSALDSITDASVTVGSDTYELCNISRAGGMACLGKETGTTKGRLLYTANVLLTIKQTS